MISLLTVLAVLVVMEWQCAKVADLYAQYEDD